DIELPDDFPSFPRRDQGPPTPPPPSQTGGHRGLPGFGGGHRNEAGRRCVSEKQPVAVIADPSIGDQVQHLAERFNSIAAPVGDHCVSVGVKSAGSDAVVDGFIGKWPGELGERPALWIPGSSISAARLTAAAGKETVTDSRSLVTSPVVLAVRTELQKA